MSETRPHGKRVSRAEVERRMALVEELHLQQFQPLEIIRTEFKKAFPGAGNRTVDEYVRRVRDRCGSESKEARRTVRAVTVKRLERYRQELWAKGDVGHVLQIERMLIDIHGLRAPEPEPPPEQEEIPWWDLAAECTNAELEMLHRVMSIDRAKKLAREGKTPRNPAIPPYPTTEPVLPPLVAAPVVAKPEESVPPNVEAAKKEEEPVEQKQEEPVAVEQEKPAAVKQKKSAGSFWKTPDSSEDEEATPPLANLTRSGFGDGGWR